jgi:hypothetical protein
MIISGAFLGRRKAQRRQRQRELQPQAQRKIQWDISRKANLQDVLRNSGAA